MISRQLVQIPLYPCLLITKSPTPVSTAVCKFPHPWDASTSPMYGVAPMGIMCRLFLIDTLHSFKTVLNTVNSAHSRWRVIRLWRFYTSRRSTRQGKKISQNNAFVTFFTLNRCNLKTACLPLFASFARHINILYSTNCSPLFIQHQEVYNSYNHKHKPS